MRQRYDFNVAVLLNPGRARILGALERLRLELTERDNLLIYYAGRAILDDETETSYWQPADAERGAGANRISAGPLSDALYAMSARHVMVVPDAAYSRTVARRPGLAIKRRARREAMLTWLSTAASRTALVSGSIEPLDDGAGDGHSVFARSFLTAIREPKETFEGGELFGAIRRLVLGNPRQTPRYANIFGAGHNGGDFLFVPVAQTPLPTRRTRERALNRTLSSRTGGRGNASLTASSRRISRASSTPTPAATWPLAPARGSRRYGRSHSGGGIQTIPGKPSKSASSSIAVAATFFGNL